MPELPGFRSSRRALILPVSEPTSCSTLFSKPCAPIGLGSADQGTAPLSADRRLAGFISGQIAFGDRTFTRTQSGGSFTAGGVTLGLDYRLDPMSAIGMSGSYFFGDMGIAGGSTKARAGTLGSVRNHAIGAGLPRWLCRWRAYRLPDDRSFDFGEVSTTASGAPEGRLIAFGADSRLPL